MNMTMYPCLSHESLPHLWLPFFPDIRMYKSFIGVVIEQLFIYSIGILSRVERLVAFLTRVIAGEENAIKIILPFAFSTQITLYWILALHDLDKA